MDDNELRGYYSQILQYMQMSTTQLVKIRELLEETDEEPEGTTDEHTIPEQQKPSTGPTITEK